MLSLGSTAALVLRERIEDFLQRRLQDRLVKLGEVRTKQDLNTYIDALTKKWIDAKPADATERAYFKKLLELWVNPESEEATERCRCGSSSTALSVYSR